MSFLHNTGRRIAAVTLAVSLMLSMGSVSAMAASSYDDFDYITDHVALNVPHKAAICNPPANMTTDADKFYLTGTSDPTQPLYLNGDVVEGRGIYGSWAVYAPLYMGDNSFTVKQGDAGNTVTITRTAPVGIVAIDKLTKVYPSYDSAYRAGSELVLSCIAPSGAAVSVQFGELRVELAQSTSAKAGLPARFAATTIVGGVAEPRNMGKLTYSMSLDGKVTTLVSAGDVYLFPADRQPTVKVTDTVATTYKDSNGRTVSTVLSGGAVDYITEQTDTMYLLGMGSWIPKETVTTVLDATTANTVSKAEWSRTEHGERIKLTGTTNPATTSWQADSKLSVTLHHTTMGVDSIDISDSRIFTSLATTAEGDSTTLTFDIEAGKALWGHTVEYADNVTIIYAKYQPKSTENASKPLAGFVVGLDAGHGGSDPGAFGTARLTGPVEKDINYANALATKKRLESLGASVIMTTYREGERSSYSDRMQAATDSKVDYYISLHCNAVAGNGLPPTGTEVYHYYTRSKPLAATLQRHIATDTGRKDRGAKSSNFRVTMTPLAPSVLVEVGFISNPVEYDRACSKQDIFATANAIGNALVELASQG